MSDESKVHVTARVLPDKLTSTLAEYAPAFEEDFTVQNLLNLTLTLFDGSGLFWPWLFSLAHKGAFL